MGEVRNVYKILARKTEGMGPSSRPRCRWDYGTKMDLNELGWQCGQESSDRIRDQ
jgi:hypothetical protein